MTIGMGLGKTSKGVERCFVWDMQELGPFLAILDKHVGKVQGNDNQTSNCSQSHPAGESSELNWKCLRQFRRITVTGSPAWRRLQGWSKGQRSSRSFLLHTCWGLGCYLLGSWVVLLPLSQNQRVPFQWLPLHFSPVIPDSHPDLSSARTMQEGQSIFINLQWFIMSPV